MYGAECWYSGRTKPPRTQRPGQPEVSARLGGHIAAIDSALVIAARGILPAWRTMPNTALIRDAGLPAAQVALEEVKLRFATHLRTVDKDHPLVQRIVLPIISRGRGAGSPQRPRTKVQRLGSLLPEVPRQELLTPHYTKGCTIDPTQGIGKKEAAARFKNWWAQLPSSHVTIFSDGSEQNLDGTRRVTYGFAIYQNRQMLHKGSGSLHPQTHVFDAEAVGAWRGLQQALRRPELRQQRIWMCIDSTSVIWGLRGNAPPSSQWAYKQCHNAMGIWDISVKWAPGHTGIEGNEAADALADTEASHPQEPEGLASCPTVTGIRSIAKRYLQSAKTEWWAIKKQKLSRWYRDWDLTYDTKAPPELALPRHTLQRLIATRTNHGDFAWYHRKFCHEDAKLECSCGIDKTPDHIVHCRRTRRLFAR